MNLTYAKNILNLFCLIQLLVAPTTLAKEEQNHLPFSFINNKTIHLRNNDLTHPQAIEIGSKISIDPKFLLEHLGSETPSQEQVQRLMLNPGEISKNKIVTKRFRDTFTGKIISDYFFPVTIRTKSGINRSGKIALQSYNRNGLIELRRNDGQDPNQFQSSEITTQMKALIDQNKSLTEAQAGCNDCAEKSLAGTHELAAIARTLNISNTDSTNSLWEKYKEFAKEFSSTNKNISTSRAGHFKRLFVKSLVLKFGEKDAGMIMAALTVFGEAPYRSSNATQIAEMAAVLKIVENRAENNFRSKSRTLQDIGVSETADARLTTILADWQFSAWNDQDNNLRHILSFNPDKADENTRRKMTLSFEAQKMIQDGKVEFLGKMNDSNLQHYHANYVNPNWSRKQKRVIAPIIKIDGIAVDLSKQRGSRHIFYSGIS